MKNDYRDFAKKLVKKAGAIAKCDFCKPIKTNWKSNFDPVTETDLKLNNLINSEIEKNFPTNNIISEELLEIQKKSVYTWYIDPIDGTIAFSKKVRYFCIGMGLTYKGKMILSVMYDPIHNEMFVAEKDKGLFLNNKRIKSTSQDDLSNAYFAIGIWQGAHYKLMPLLHELIDKMRVGTVKESLMVSVCHSAVGRMDGALFSGNTPWDIAPCILIAKEAGLTVTDLWGKDPADSKYTTGLIIAKQKLHQEILKLTKKYLN